MAITLGTLRTFCREVASSDNADTTAAREFMGWINDALDKLYKASPWDRTILEQKLTIVPRESLTDVTVTQGSLTLASAVGFLAKWLSARWELVIDGYSRGTFELAAIGTPATTATMRTGDEWINATALNKTVYFLNTRFSLPKVKEIRRVQVVDSGVIVKVCTPTEFDYLKAQDPGAQGADPRYCTWRKGYLEIWPSPGTNYRKLSLTYQKEYTRLADSDADATEVDWDEEELNVLKKAILVEAAVTQGENAVVSYEQAKIEFAEALKSSKGWSMRNAMTGPMGRVHLPPGPVRRAPWAWGEVTDA